VFDDVCSCADGVLAVVDPTPHFLKRGLRLRVIADCGAGPLLVLGVLALRSRFRAGGPLHHGFL
jgi:hypothetical protein